MTKQRKNYKAVVFDLDGTLVDSLSDLTDACNAVMAHYGLPAKSYEEGKTLIGRGLRVLMKRALPPEMGDDPAVLDEAEALLREEYARRYTAKTRPYPGIPELLGRLKRKGIPFCVSTNKPDGAAKIVVEALLNAGDFTAVYGQMEGRPRKPDPTSVFELTQKMGVEPADCVYMGDSIVDYETAVNAGMLPLLCMWGFGDTARLRTLEDALCIEGPEELLPHLEGFSDGEGL